MNKSHIITTLAMLTLVACAPTPYEQFAQGQALYQAGRFTEAIPHIQAAAESGDTQAQLLLGKCYDFGKGVVKNTQQAAVWYTRAAQAGNANAQDNLGTCYATGAGVPKDLAQAFHWYSRAAAQNYPSAYNNLGLCYRNGEGVAQDAVRAANCFRQAAELGNAAAQYNLGRCYYHGLGVPQSETDARLWVGKAAAQNYQNAILFAEDNNWN